MQILQKFVEVSFLSYILSNDTYTKKTLTKPLQKLMQAIGSSLGHTITFLTWSNGLHRFL